MDSESFIDAIKLHVRDAAIEDTIANLENPPGRRVEPEVRELSDWYKALPAAQKAYVNSVVTSAVGHALFGLLVVIDGDRAIEDGSDRGRLELAHIGEKRVILNPSEAIGLHDLFNAV